MKKHYLSKVLRLLSIFLIAGFTQLSAAGYSQTITLKANKVSLASILETIRKQTGFAVYANTLHLEDTKLISITATNMPLKDFLDKILVDQPVNASIADKTIVLSRNRTETTNSGTKQTNTDTKQAQQLTVSGKVVSLEDGTAVTASINIKGTAKGVSTDASGNYKITGVKTDDILVFSSIGFQNKEIAVAGRSQIDVKMAAQLETLNQVMVVAFGTAKKSTFTGSASVIGEDTFKNRPSTEVSQALTGTTPGLQIGTSHGLPGSEPTIRIRGIGSFNASNNPLIILDGVPYDNAISSINPNDIENITVLKDASSAALYGARGANGVILINTKKGKSGKPKADAKYSYGLTSRQSSDYKTLGERDYMEYYWEAHRNNFLTGGDNLATANAKASSAVLAGMVYNPYLMPTNELFDADGKLNPAAVNNWADDTDWYGGITRTGKRHDGSLSISGGNEKSDYYTSLGYVQEEGFVIGSVYDRVSAKANVNTKVTDWLKIGSNLTLASAKYNGEQTETSGTIANPFRSTRFLGPLYPIHLHNPATGEYILDENGNKIPDFGGGWTSPDGTITVPKRPAFVDANHPYELQQNLRGGLRQTLNLKGYADVNLLKDLKFTVNGSLGANSFRSWNGQYIFPLKNNAGSSAQNTSTTYTWNFQQLLNYNKRIGDHNFDVLAGHESYRYQYWYMSTSMKTQTIPNDNFEYANYSELNALPNSYMHNYRVEGYLSRVNYDYREKYFASASFRRDGSSRFHTDARWGNFWSIGAGWSIEKEDFLQKINFVNQLKLRASYGVVGNDDLDGYYPWRATYEVLSNGEPGYSKATLENKNLTWETSKSFDFGLDFAFLRHKLKGSLEYFNRVSDNLLFEVPQPISSGIEIINQNAGTMYNRGVELSLDGNVLKTNDWSFNLNFNTTYIKNKLTKLPIDPYVVTMYKIQEGHSRYDFWLREWYGVNPATGYNLFTADLTQQFNSGELVEIDGKQYTENLDKAEYGFRSSSIPKLTGGFGTDISYKNFNLRLNFYYQLGGKFYDDGYREFMIGSSTYFNQHVDLLRRWRNPGDITDVAIATTNANKTANTDAANSTRWLVTSNMLELTNINLSYNFSQKFLKSKNISNATIYFSANNAYLLAARKGLYPRRNFHAGYLANEDIYPPSSVASIGLTLTF